MQASDWINDYKSRVQRMIDNRAADVLVIANDLKTLVQFRIQSRGEAYTGSQFSPYSPSYVNVRKSAGAQTRYRDYTVSGQLWRNIRPEVTSSDDTQTTVVTTARTSDDIKKLRGALVQPKSNPSGNILLPNEIEIQTAIDANADRIKNYIG